eukprot:6348458-Pyramimonas_sp.AAC.1
MPPAGAPSMRGDDRRKRVAEDICPEAWCVYLPSAAGSNGVVWSLSRPAWAPSADSAGEAPGRAHWPMLPDCSGFLVRQGFLWTAALA